MRGVPDALRPEGRREDDVRNRAVAPVGDVHRGVQPRGVSPAERRAVLRSREVGGRREDLELHVDAERLDRALDDLGELRDLSRLLRRERDRLFRIELLNRIRARPREMNTGRRQHRHVVVAEAVELNHGRRAGDQPAARHAQRRQHAVSPRHRQ